MLKIKLPGQEFFDDKAQEFVEIGSIELELEHSLVALSKWESIWEKPFLGPDKKTSEETLSYIHCMVVSPEIPIEDLYRLSEENIKDINEYINAKMSATWFNELTNRKTSREVHTAEIIYYWMLTLQIPTECETWHLGRLFTLIKVVNEKNAPKKKVPRRDVLQSYAQLNAQRRAQLNTSG